MSSEGESCLWRLEALGAEMGERETTVPSSASEKKILYFKVLSQKSVIQKPSLALAEDAKR
jgi:hypothetical protein